MSVMIHSKKSPYNMFNPNIRNIHVSHLFFTNVNANQNVSKNAIKKINALINEIDMELDS